MVRSILGGIARAGVGIMEKRIDEGKIREKMENTENLGNLGNLENLENLVIAEEWFIWGFSIQ